MSKRKRQQSNTVISVSNVSKTFKIPKERNSQLKHYFLNPFHKPEYVKFDALKDVSFEVKKGEFLGIIGRNGSGKSTLLKILAGVYQPSEGKIKINGKVTPFLELGVGFNPELSARENIFLNGTILGMTRKYLLKKFDEIVDFAEIREFVDMPVKNFSSGMQVRLAFAIMIQSDADTYLVDEVLAVGDANFQEKCFDVFRRFKKDGKTVVFVSHDLGSVELFCDRAIWIDRGEVEADNGTNKVIFEYNKFNIEDRLEELEQESVKAVHTVEPTQVKIELVTFHNEEGNKSKLFNTGESITVKIHYKSTGTIRNPVVGISLHNAMGNLITGPNTKTSHIKIKQLEKKGVISYTILKSPLLAGMYLLTVGIFNEDATVPYDFIDQGFSFNILKNAANQNGIIKLDEEWIINK